MYCETSEQCVHALVDHLNLLCEQLLVKLRRHDENAEYSASLCAVAPADVRTRFEPNTRINLLEVLVTSMRECTDTI